MITQMQNLTDAEHAILNQTWRGKKILSYLQAYGFDYEFCRSFRLTEGEKTGWMLLFNATLLICAEQPIALEETKTFVEMHLPFRIECPASFLPTLATLPNYQKLRRTMFVLTPQPVSEEFQPEAVQKQPDLTAVYQILHEGFPNLLSYPLWLTDTSHRVRRGLSQSFLLENYTTATIQYIVDGVALIGHVGTIPEERGKFHARQLLYWIGEKLTQDGFDVRLFARPHRVSYYEEIGFKERAVDLVLERKDTNG